MAANRMRIEIKLVMHKRELNANRKYQFVHHHTGSVCDQTNPVFGGGLSQVGDGI